LKKTKASAFYDEYHALSAQKGVDDPVVRKTYALMRDWMRRLDPPKGCRMLDLSCGLGQFLKAAHDHDPSLRLEGLDHSEFACRASRQRVPSAKIRRGDAMRTPYPPKSFDVVSCVGSLEHYPDPEKGLSEIHRILKDGGKAFIYVPNLFFLGYIFLVWRTGETPHEAGQNEYERFETRQGWEELLAKAGLKVRAVTKHNDMYATERVPGFVKLAYRILIQPFIPLNLSYCFGFWVEKAGVHKKGRA
jgi:ubiquinone/menaquinone biosynthesis C-methylase UbiE